jgi:hypothetical protein
MFFDMHSIMGATKRARFACVIKLSRLLGNVKSQGVHLEKCHAETHRRWEDNINM